MATLPWLPKYLIRSSFRPLRKVHLSQSIEHAYSLQQRNPFELVALPVKAEWKEVKEIDWWYPQLCARASILNIRKALDIGYYTPCQRVLVGNVLFEFKGGVVSHELVIPSHE